MSNNAHDSHQADAPFANRQAFGVDALGRTHYWFPAEQEVVIFDGDDTRHQDVDDLELWKDWIDARRGWEWNRWTDRSVADLLVEPLREGA